ncbi:MAG: hypothetical protein ACKVT1_09780 [Dehalococcoidia bacterium]
MAQARRRDGGLALALAGSVQVGGVGRPIGRGGALAVSGWL